MGLGDAVLLGVLQGLTEFLPISSSGHLALVQALLPGFHQPGVLFDVMLHVGTASAVVWFERRQIVQWLREPEGLRLGGLLLMGMIATAAVGFPLRSFATGAFHRPALVGVALILTGFVVALTRYSTGGDDGETTMSLKQAAVVGLAQGAAVFPGLSRSGFTIAAGLGMGLERVWAARFSFLLGVPAIAGVTCFEVVARRHELASMTPSFWLACLIGGVTAAVTGFVAIRIVVKAVSTRVFHRFSWYCIPLGMLVLVISLGMSR